MNVKNLFTDEDAVSPVIGVILMVAITVILAAVIGAFVLGIGSSQEKAPQASLSFSYNDQGATWGSNAQGSGSGQYANISHDGGETIQMSSLSFSVGGTATGPIDQGDVQLSDDSWTAGQVAALSVNSSDVSGASSGDSVVVTWSASSGDSSQILAEGTLP